MLVYITGTQGRREEEIREARSVAESFGDEPVTPDGGDVQRAIGICNAYCAWWEPTEQEQELCKHLICIQYIQGSKR